jgi:hypothetical protein
VSAGDDIGINQFLMRFQVNKKGYFLTSLILFLILATVGEILRLLLDVWLTVLLGSGTGEKSSKSNFGHELTRI